jgi:DNA repair exonuclease SbcCD ATPase subunit
MKEFVSIKEAAKRLKKSERTVKRYLSNLSEIDRRRVTRYDKTRVTVDIVLLSLLKDGKGGRNRISESKEKIDPLKKEIEILKKENRELFEIVKDKDNELKKKDGLIAQNLADFKILTSKVLFLQEQNTQQAQEPKSKASVKVEPSRDGVVNKNDSFSLLVMVLIIFILFLAIFFLVSEIFL